MLHLRRAHNFPSTNPYLINILVVGLNSWLTHLLINIDLYVRVGTTSLFKNKPPSVGVTFLTLTDI
jgi:hypothetical protein